MFKGTLVFGNIIKLLKGNTGSILGKSLFAYLFIFLIILVKKKFQFIINF